MKIIRIDYAQVPSEKWSDEFLVKLALRIRKAQEFIALQSAVEITCIHEAGHAIYWEQIRSTVQHIGPTVEYVADIDQWRFYPMMTVPSPSPTLLSANYRNLLAIAKGAAAGGEFVRRLLDANEEDAGDVDDHHRFLRVCRILRENAEKQNKFVCFNEDKIWKAGQSAVSTDLQDSEFQATARNRAKQISRDLFE